MKSLGAHLRALAVLGALITAACGGTEEAEPAQQAEEPAAAAEPAPAQEAQLPDTTVDAVWSYLQAQDYRNNWDLWPGKGELYEGGQPHGMLLTSYVNSTAMEALDSGAESMPVGAILIKENFTPDSTLAAVTVMYKTESFNPDHNNWWFLKRNADGSVDAGGRGAGCESCHGGQRADNDYIFTSELGSSEAGGGAGSP